MVRLTPAFDALPLALGITGHRHVREGDLQLLERAMRDWVSHFQRRFPHTPLIVLSSLAEGADRIAARVALALGLQLVVPLPLAAAEFETDFETAESRSAFATLLGSAAGFFVVRSELSVEAPGAREGAYTAASAFVADWSQILIAFWDGDPTKDRGGTADAVHFKLHGVPDTLRPRSALDPPEVGPVLHIKTPREDGAETMKAGAIEWLYPPDYVRDPQSAFMAAWRRIDGYNRDISRLDSNGERPASLRLIDREELSQLPPAATTACGWYAKADRVALHYQHRTRSTLRALLLLAFVAALSFQLGNLMETRLLSVVYLASLLLAWAWYLWARRGEHQKKHLDYRALAEGLRVQIFWTLAGLTGSVSDHYLRKQRSELDWVRQALRIRSLQERIQPAQHAPQSFDLEHRLRIVLRRWVEPQAAYFRAAAQGHGRRADALKSVGYGFFLTSLLLAILKPFWPSAHPIIVGIGLAPIIGALVHAYGEKMAVSQLAHQYGRMSLVFGSAKAQIEQDIAAGRLKAAQSLVRELATEALAEHADWVLLHRERPVDVPAT